jgi:NDP-sugar pyrophosphorylase family protein
VIEHNIDRLNKFGIGNVRISVRHMSDKIMDYFGDGSSKDMSISYVKEDKPLGTIGSVKLAGAFLQETILVMNSDLLTNIDFEALYQQFIDDKADMIVATVPYKINVPYAILEVEGSRIHSLKEKPTYTYYANAGIYLMKKEVIASIPSDTKFDAPDLIEKLIEAGKVVTSYPILEYWLDIGKHEDYIKAQDDIKHIKL